MVFIAPEGDLTLPERADAWMQDGFELSAGGGISEGQAGHFIAAETSIGGENLGAKGLSDLGKGGLARFNELAGEKIGINDRDTAVTQELISGGFAHSDAAGEAKE